MPSCSSVSMRASIVIAVRTSVDESALFYGHAAPLEYALRPVLVLAGAVHARAAHADRRGRLAALYAYRQRGCGVSTWRRIQPTTEWAFPRIRRKDDGPTRHVSRAHRATRALCRGEHARGHRHPDAREAGSRHSRARHAAGLGAGGGALLGPSPRPPRRAAPPPGRAAPRAAHRPPGPPP